LFAARITSSSFTIGDRPLPRSDCLQLSAGVAYPRIHRWNALPHWVSPFMRQLWREANPQTPEQLPLPILGDIVNSCVFEQTRLF
jgi:hypothetical protein